MSPKAPSLSTPSDADLSSSSSIDVPSADPAPHPEDDLSDHIPPSSPKSMIIGSPPLESRPYSPHGVGIGILSPQPVIGPFAPISRANLAPLQVKSSPSEQRSNPLDSVSPRHPSGPFGEHTPRTGGSHAVEEPPAPVPPPPHLRYVEDRSAKDKGAGEHIPLAPLSSTGASSQTGLRIALPPHHPPASTSAPSPPLQLPPTQDSVSDVDLSAEDSGPSGTALEAPAPPATADVLLPSSELNIDFSEFDTEGYSALEKVYLFSRSRASFHRVFVAHALPGYLLGGEPSGGDLSSKEIIEQITPSDAVEYVLPLLIALAMDEDETVKEALAAELVPIIWWFITHCRLVNDDSLPPPSAPAPSPLTGSASPGSEFESLPHPHSPPPNLLSGDFHAASLSREASTDERYDDGPTPISVQAFTPILGTLLLSPNGLIGGSARYAVVELLRRLRRSDERESDAAQFAGQLAPSSTTAQASIGSLTPSQVDLQERDSLDVGLFQHDERRLFEHELIFRVIIGMGHLDIDDGQSDDQAGEDDGELALDSGPSTAVPTPQPSTSTADAESYFPPTPAWNIATVTANPVGSVASPPLQTADPAPSASAGAASTLPPSISPSPPVSSTSSLSGSPGHSSSSTPSLTSSTSSSSGEYPDAAEPIGTDSFDRALAENLPDDPTTHVAEDEEDADAFEMKTVLPVDDWAATTTMVVPAPDAEPMMPRALPTTPPFEVPPLAAAPLPGSAGEAASPIIRLPMPQASHAPPAASPARELPPPHAPQGGWISPNAAARELEPMEEPLAEQPEDDVLSEEAAVGRLSSMSLMAAVTASGSISEETQRAFAAEVEHIGHDPVYWVRREASFAVGALAKVVPTEVVISSLLPLFHSLCQDHTWHVRHSVLFALPAILSRLKPRERHDLAVSVIMPLSHDEESTVRSGVLEALGEVMHTFVADEGGPPRELVDLFLGVRESSETQWTTDEVPTPSATRWPLSPQSPTSAPATSSAWSDYGTDAGTAPDIYEDPQRPLICAFNYPAVALTLGRDRWPELRSLYHSLAQDSSFKIRRTLAASLGEIAKIIGEAHARADLMYVFHASLHAEESEVRTKAVDALETFVRALAAPERAEVARAFEEAFALRKLSSWRERENAAKALRHLVGLDGVDEEVLMQMLTKALSDPAAAVREAAVSVLPTFVRAWTALPTRLGALLDHIDQFATSGAFRQRTVYVMCIQELLVDGLHDIVVARSAFWDSLSSLVRDPIVDVRIRVSRLLGLISDQLSRGNNDVAEKALTLARELVQDASHEVRAFAEAVMSSVSLPPAGTPPPPAAPLLSSLPKSSVATFSRPPPPSPS